jgi:hypothetical protein
MMTTFRLLTGSLVLASLASAQSPETMIFTGRFPFVSLDSANERLGGSITKLSEFEFSMVTPGVGAAARSLLPATAMQCYLADADNNGSYTKFQNLRTYFENLQLGGVFVRHADRGAATWDKVFFTVRDNVTTAGKDLEVFTNGGTAVHTMVPGDWVRLLPNGNVEFFLTAAQLAVAAGPAPSTGASVHGAHALLQTAAGDLYYVPVQGGHWINGNFGNIPAFAQDGAICKIDAASITYDANGNVASILPNSARIIIDEVAGGPGSAPLTVRQMVVNSGAMNRDGIAVVATGIYGKTCGLGLDQAGGTFFSTFADLAGNYTQEPNLIFCSDAGSYAGTIFTTANNGGVATINGVVCGSLLTGVPATGSWLGVQFDYANFQPSLMGFSMVGALTQQPLLLDQANYGALPNITAQATWDIDLHGAPFTLAFLFVGFGPGSPGQIVPSLPLVAFPPVFTADSHADVFVAGGAQSLGLVVTDGFGYGTWSFANLNTGGFAGITFVMQAAGIVNNSLQISTPVLTQMQ